MKSLFEKTSTDEIIKRIENLTSQTERKWGKMDVSQMLAHCSVAMDLALGNTFPPRVLIGKIFGRIFRPMYSNERPFSKNSPTDKRFIFKDKRDFDFEKIQLIEKLHQFQHGGEGNCTNHPHPFFGKITTKEWGIGMYKHLDHHLRQFGV